MTLKLIKVYSKLKIYDALNKINKHEEFKAFLNACPSVVQDRWSLAADLEQDDEDFISLLATIKDAIQITDEQLVSILHYATTNSIYKLDKVAAQEELDSLLNMPVPTDEEVLDLAKQGKVAEFYSLDRQARIVYLQGELNGNNI